MLEVAAMLLVLIIAVFALILIVQVLEEKIVDAIFARRNNEVEREIADLQQENRRLRAELRAIERARVEVKEIGNWTSLRYGGTYED